MAAGRELNRGDVWLISLDPTVGSEIRKTRPCVVVSPPEMHDNIRTVIIAPLTSGSRPAPARVAVTFNGIEGLVMVEHVRSVDKQRLIKRLGSLDPSALSQVLDTLQSLFSE